MKTVSPREESSLHSAEYYFYIFPLTGQMLGKIRKCSPRGNFRKNLPGNFYPKEVSGKSLEILQQKELQFPTWISNELFISYRQIVL
jgi:hypothetical protein